LLDLSAQDVLLRSIILVALTSMMCEWDHWTTLQLQFLSSMPLFPIIHNGHPMIVR
jgi:hypothetical protein